MFIRLLLALFLFLGVANVHAAPAITSVNPASLWYTITYIAPGDVSSLCKAFLYGNSVSTLTLTKTSTLQKPSTILSTDLTKTSSKTVSVTTTAYAITKHIVTTLVSQGVTVVTTIPCHPQLTCD